MIGNSLVDFVNIRVSIAALRLIAPTSIVYLVCCAIRPNYLFTPLVLFAAAEASFYLFVYLPRSYFLQAPPSHPPPTLTQEQRHFIFKKCLESGISDTTIDAPFPSGWFIPKGSTPRKEDVIDWLLWALFSTSRAQIDIQVYEEELSGYINEIEALLGKKLQDGQSRDEGIQSMRVNLDPVVMLHRPLVWYFIVAFVDSYTSIMLAYLGFRHYAPRESQWSRTFPPRPVLTLISRRAPEGVAFPYWYRPHKSNTKLPFVFIHGIGIGLFPYIPFFQTIVKGDSDVGIVLPELMSICMHMTPRSVPPRLQMMASLNTVLESLKEQEANEVAQKPHLGPEASDEDAGMRVPLMASSRESSGYESTSSTTKTQPVSWDQIVLIGHSYGTFVAGWIIRQIVDINALSSADSTSIIFTPAESLANKIAHAVLVDPVPILLSNPTVAHNFLYRKPATVCPTQLGSVQLEAFIETLVDIETAPPSPPPTFTLNPIPPPPSSSKFSFPSLTSYYSSAAAWQLWYFASRDADVARTLFRTFFWTEGGMWREEVEAFLLGDRSDTNVASEPFAARSEDGEVARAKQGNGKRRNMAVVLGGMDQVIPAEAIRRHLTREERWKERWVGNVDIDGQVQSVESASVGAAETNGGQLEVLFNPRLDHAVIFDEERWTVPLVDVIRRYVRDI